MLQITTQKNGTCTEYSTDITFAIYRPMFLNNAIKETFIIGMYPRMSYNGSY